MTIDLRDRALTLALSAGIHPEPTADTIARARVYLDFLMRKNQPAAGVVFPKDTSIHDIGLPGYASFWLAFGGVTLLSELLEQNEAELLRIPGFGRGSLAVTINRLKELGLRLKIHQPLGR